MIKFLLITFLILFGCSLHAQDTTLRYDKNTHKVYRGDQKMSMDDLFITMRPHPQSFELIESARDCKFYATLFYTLGAAPVGFTVGYLLFTNEIAWPVLAVGVVLVGIGIPIHTRYLKQTKRAINSYNNINATGALTSRLQLSLNMNQNGIGLCLSL